MWKPFPEATNNIDIKIVELIITVTRLEERGIGRVVEVCGWRKGRAGRMSEDGYSSVGSRGRCRHHQEAACRTPLSP